jgi:hypothetical protein
VTSGRARCCTPGVAGRFQEGRKGFRDVFRPHRDRWKRRLDVTLPPKQSVTSVLKKAGTIDYYCRER